MTVTWTINGTTIDGVETTQVDRTRGATVPLGLLFHDATNGTISDRYDAIRAYDEYADRVEFGIDANRRPWFYEQTPDDDPVRDHVWKIEPHSDVDTASFWGLVVGIDDPSRSVGGLKRLDADVVFLADLHRYADRQAVINDLGTYEGCFLLVEDGESATVSSPETIIRCGVIRGEYIIQA